MGNDKSRPTDKAILYMKKNKQKLIGELNIPESIDNPIQKKLTFPLNIRACDREGALDSEEISDAAIGFFGIPDTATFELRYVDKNDRLYVCSSIADSVSCHCHKCRHTKVTPVLHINIPSPDEDEFAIAMDSRPQRAVS